MAKLSRKDEINSKGHARGWHAQMLKKKAESQERTMAEIWLGDIFNSMAFNVPAELIELTSKHAKYRFLDGSECILNPPNPKKDR